MKKLISILIVLFVFPGCYGRSTEYPIGPEMTRPMSKIDVEDPLTISTMKITSPSFNHQESLPSKFTCDGENVNPALNVSEIPEKTESLVLIVDDPDAPSGTWIHWVVFDIEPTVTAIAENSIPAGGVQAVTSFGEAKYGGPCPPSGSHRYFFKVYALDTKLGLEQNTTVKDLGEAMEGHILEYAELIGNYERTKT